MSNSFSDTKLIRNYELQKRLKNESRKKLLKFLYIQPRNYKELAEFSHLKPGSLYHHLSVLEPMIQKIDHGQYQITELGRGIIEEMNIVNPEVIKPKIDTMSPSLTISTENTANIKSKIKLNEDYDIDTNAISSDINEVTSYEKLFSQIWLSYSNYLLLTLTFMVMIFLGIKGVAFAGSAIYSVGNLNPFLFDLIAIMLGISSLYIIEDLINKYPIYSRLKFITIVRFISMLPSLIIGISLLILFNSGVIPSQNIYPVIFSVGIILGTLLSATGIYYLRGQSMPDAILLSIIQGIIDLLLGFVILISA